eukprot:TRINITY_DN34690_c0_g1_i1.p1 TRINITY_DN34690_c0_g1~~TRINITY_DN34690_c0_g1_i1.p1  ORF type:complete len:486 (+),score=81.73 TRINITY_DN34690_c0_g1_i1:32-1459(+)
MPQDGWGIENFLLRRESTVPDEEFVKMMEKIDGHLERCRGARGLKTVGTCPDDDSGVRVRLERFYYKHAPSHIGSVDIVLEFFLGREEELFRKLEEGYGPEPTPHETLTADVVVNHPGVKMRDHHGFIVENYKAYLKVKDLCFNTPERDETFEKIRGANLDFKTLSNSAKKCTLYQYGLPNDLRPLAWAQLTSASVNQKSHPDEYRASLASALSLNNEATVAISKDMNRTFPNCTLFEEGSEMYTSLHRVLSAVSFSTEEGYCQSMNFVAGILLLVLKDEEVSYWVLKEMVSGAKYNRGYYDVTMRTLMVDQVVMKKLLEDSQTADKLADLGVSLENFTIKWFLCIFIDVMPLETVLHLWDIYLMEGVTFLLRFSLVLSKEMASLLENTEDFTTALSVIDDYLSTLTLVGPLVREAAQISLSPKQLEGLRATCQPPTAYSPQQSDAETVEENTAASPTKKLKKKVRNIFKRGKRS